MGEYIEDRGDVMKLGTCEDLYYVTYDDLKTIVDTCARLYPNNLQPRAYLGNGFRYRFPFPDRNGKPDNKEDFDRGELVTVPDEILFDGEHYVIAKSLKPKSSFGFNINAMITCPFDPKADPESYSRGPHTPVVEIVQQKVVEGCLWRGVRCPYWRIKWRLTPREGWLLAEHVRKGYGDKYYHQIADMLEEGYQREIV